MKCAFLLLRKFHRINLDRYDHLWTKIIGMIELTEFIELIELNRLIGLNKLTGLNRYSPSTLINYSTN